MEVAETLRNMGMYDLFEDYLDGTVTDPHVLRRFQNFVDTKLSYYASVVHDTPRKTSVRSARPEQMCDAMDVDGRRQYRKRALAEPARRAKKVRR